MKNQLQISLGRCSDRGRKAVNQDFYDVSIPKQPVLGSKGIVIALADGISSSDVSQIASETAVKGFIEDYYCTPEPWSVKTSVKRVLQATNSWLYAQTRNSPYRYSMDRGYVCTFSTLLLKSTTAHIFHAGDSRIYRLLGKRLEQLTDDHRLQVSRDKSYLSRALGMKELIEIDYKAHAVDKGDIFLLATDGIYEYVDEPFVVNTILETQDDLDRAAESIRDEAYRQGSPDNLTVLIVRIDDLPNHQLDELHYQANTLPSPPVLCPRMHFDGFDILRSIHISGRSHVHLACDSETGENVIIKTPSVEMRSDPAYLERFLMEEWVARRINSAHVIKPHPMQRQRNFLYLATEFIEGQTLAQWMVDNPRPELETVRGIIDQVARGLRAFHRLEILHQDLRPNNIMIDTSGTVKIIDFGSTRIAGLSDDKRADGAYEILGTAQYTAPEYYLGEPISARSDQYSLGVLTYQMLSGGLPYAPRGNMPGSRAALQKLRYRSVLDDNRTIPIWVDLAIKKAVNPNPNNRYEEISEFIHDLRQPNRAFLGKTRPPLIERSPVRFWQAVSLMLFLTLIALAATHPGLAA